jgi:hypothetical protein
VADRAAGDEDATPGAAAEGAAAARGVRQGKTSFGWERASVNRFRMVSRDDDLHGIAGPMAPAPRPGQEGSLPLQLPSHRTPGCPARCHLFTAPHPPSGTLGRRAIHRPRPAHFAPPHAPTLTRHPPAPPPVRAGQGVPLCGGGQRDAAPQERRGPGALQQTAESGAGRSDGLLQAHMRAYAGVRGADRRPRRVARVCMRGAPAGVYAHA